MESVDICIRRGKTGLQNMKFCNIPLVVRLQFYQIKARPLYSNLLVRTTRFYRDYLDRSPEVDLIVLSKKMQNSSLQELRWVWSLRTTSMENIRAKKKKKKRKTFPRTIIGLRRAGFCGCVARFT